MRCAAWCTGVHAVLFGVRCAAWCTGVYAVLFGVCAVLLGVHAVLLYLRDARNDCAHVSDLQVLELQTKHLTISLAANDTLFASFLVCECRKEQMSPLPLGGIPERLSC